MPKVGGRRRKTRTHKEYTEEDLEKMGNTPKAFIIKRGKVSNQIKQLVTDFREIMYPYTSMKLQDSDKTKIKDYLKAAGYYQMSHMVILTSTKKNSYIRFLQNPRGPTFTFRILNFSNRSEVINAQTKFKSYSRIFTPPILIMNGFQKEYDGLDNTPNTQHIKLLGDMISSMFPAVSIDTNLKAQKRIILFTYQKDKLHIRHYYISFNQKGIDKKIKKIIKANKMPNLSKYNSFQDFLQNTTQLASDTEQSDFEELEVEDKKKSKQQMSIRLHEIGPRLTLKLYKIEEGFLNGTVAYNRVVQKSNKALLKLKKLRSKKFLLKKTRREQQEQNVQNKKKNNQTISKAQNIQEYDNITKKVKKQQKQYEENEKE